MPAPQEQVAPFRVLSPSEIQQFLCQVKFDDDENSTRVLTWLKNYDLDPLEPYYYGKTLVRCIIDADHLSWDIRREILYYVVNNESEFNREVTRIRNHPLMRAIRAGDLQAVKRLAKNEIQSIDQQYPSVKYLLNWMEFVDDNASLSILKEMKSAGVQIQEEYLIQSLNSASPLFIEELFKGQAIHWTDATASQCLARVQYREEPLIWETLKKCGWPYHNALTVAIEERNLPFVKWLIEQNIPIQESDREAALACGDLEILECLVPLQKISQEDKYYLFSKLDKIQEIDKNKLSIISILARYSKKLDLTSMSMGYVIDTNKYVESQMEYGAHLRKAVVRMLEELRSGETDLLTIIYGFAKARYEMAYIRKDRDLENFLQFRTLLPETQYFTPFGSLYDRNYSRYTHFIPLMRQVAAMPETKELKKEDDGYRLYYSDGPIKYPLTKVSFDQHLWIHTTKCVLVELWPKLQSLHEELLAMKVDPNSLKEFQDKLAKAFWLGCNLVITMRGNAQYFLMWLSAIVEYHGFDPLVTKREFHQPDCCALVLPLSEFVARFPTFFENPLRN